jgi:hypothetical protein
MTHGDRTLALLHSPMISSSSWGDTPVRLRDDGIEALVVDISDDQDPPFAERYVRAAATAIRDGDRDGGHVVLVGHSGAGPLLPAVAAALKPAVAVKALIYCDANLPRPGVSRLDLMEAQKVEFDTFRSELAAGRRYPDWTDAELAELVPAAEHRALLLAGVKTRGEAFFTEPLPAPPLPAPPLPPTVVQGYLRLSAGYERPATAAEANGWTTHRLDGGHFHPLVEPAETASALSGLAQRLLGETATRR